MIERVGAEWRAWSAPVCRIVVLSLAAWPVSVHRSWPFVGRLDELGMVRTAFRAARVPKAQLVIEDRGDGMIVIVPAAVSKADLLSPMIPALAAVRVDNKEVSTNAWLRLPEAAKQPVATNFTAAS